MFVLGSFLFEYKRSANAWWAAAVFFGHSLFHVLIIWRFSFVCVYFKTYDSCRFVIFWRAFVGARSSNNVLVLKINYNYQYSNKTSNKQVFNYDKLAFVIFKVWKFLIYIFRNIFQNFEGYFLKADLKNVKKYYFVTAWKS